MVRCMCPVSRNRKGRPATRVSGTKLLSGAVFTRVMSITPKRVCSSESFSSPSWRLWNTWMRMRPPVRSCSKRPISLTPSTVG